MRILHVITTINRGGAENHLKDLIHGQLMESNVNVSCAYLKGNSYWQNFLSNIGCDVYPLKLLFYGDFLPLFRLWKIIKFYRPDIVHAHLAPAELYTRIVLLFFPKVKFVITRHNHYKFYDGFGAYLIELWVISRVSWFICISDSVINFLLLRFPSKKEISSVIEYGIDPVSISNFESSKRDLFRSTWNVPSDEILLGTVARLIPIKAIHILLLGYAKFKATTTKKTKLMIVGSGPLEPELRKLALKLGIDKSTIFTGFLEDIPIVMQSIDIFLLTSIEEGFGLVIIEAMSAKKPVISTNVSAISNIVIDNKTGYLVPANDSVALSVAIGRLVDDENIRMKFGLSGHSHVLTNFSINIMLKKTFLIYKRLLDI